jgi:hypothetical protein
VNPTKEEIMRSLNKTLPNFHAVSLLTIDPVLKMAGSDSDG